ncbi:MAG: hypothetical protein J6Y52_08005 [Bacteroidales bacterium]|nr:hypothetical protein [Bacteroidales bacterium]
MEDQPLPPDVQPVSSSGKFRKTLLYTFLGTTMSILLTFGTSQLVSQHRKVQERKLTALMVIGNIEKFAQRMDLFAAQMAWRDTMATYLLYIPLDSLDAPGYATIMAKGMPSYVAFTYDKTVENVFSNSIETWKNLGNFAFINNVGNCFATMKTIEGKYNEQLTNYVNLVENIKHNPDDYPGETPLSRYLHCEEYRILLSRYREYTTMYLYFADKIRTLNAVNMQLVDISEEEIEQFVHEYDEIARPNGPIKKMKDFLPPAINHDSLPDFHAWIGY